MRRSFDLIVLGCSSVVVSGAFLALFFGTEETGVEGNPAWRALLAITYTAVVLVLIPRYRESLYVLRRNWSLVALLFLAVMSSLWAEMPDLVLRRSVGLFGTTVFGIAVAIRLSLQEQLLMLRWLFRVIAILSIASIVLFPGSRISGDGEWMGVFEHKNAMGTVMGLSLLVESQMSGVDRRARVSKVLFMLLYAVLLLKSDSVTPVVALTGTLILLSIYKFASLRLRVPFYALFAIVAVLASVGVSLVAANADNIMGILGRSSNLTGRTEIWGLVVSFIPQRPIFGYGYSGFWLGASPESFVVNRVLGGPVMYSHNGYLEIFLTLGAVGFLLVMVFLISGMKRALVFSRQQECDIALWPLAFLVYFILHNLGECTILVQQLEWAMCVSCIAGTDLALLAGSAEEEVAAWVPLEEFG